MLKFYVIPAFLLLFSCGGSLSEEQRKKFKEEIEQNRIVRVTDSEIISFALAEGKKVMAAIERSEASQTDSLEKLYNVRIHWAVPGQAALHDLEHQLIEAYVAGMATGTIQDNIQKMRRADDPQQYDSLVYSKPVVTSMPDGTDRLEGVWNVYLARKNIVLQIGKAKK